MNIKDKLLLRQQVTSSLRDFLSHHQYVEADVPVLSPSLIPESYLEVFETSIKGPTVDSRLATRDLHKAFLTASPEAYLKRLLVEGSGNVYYLGKAFRNGEPFGPMHNHEFTILEWYRVGYEYQQLMQEIERMISSVATTLKTDIGIDFFSPWEYITMEEAFDQFVPDSLPATQDFLTHHIDNFDALYVQYIEPNLGTRGKPTFLIDFPTWQSPLARSRETGDGSQVAERFELYINGIELVNGWTELTDWKKQEQNFAVEQEERKKMNKTPYPADTGFIESLKKGMPECAGAAMGVDRLCMVLGGLQKLEDVILFPVKNLLNL